MASARMPRHLMPEFPARLGTELGASTMPIQKSTVMTAGYGSVLADDMSSSRVSLDRYNLCAGQRFNAAIEQARVNSGFHFLEHLVHEVDQRIACRDRALDAPIGHRAEDRKMPVDRAGETGMSGQMAMIDVADAAIDRVQRP